MTIQAGRSDLISVDQVAVVVTLGGMPHHAGLIFRNKEKTLCVLHLANHKRLRSESYPGMRPSGESFCWIAAVLDLPPATSRTLVGILRKVAKREPYISPHISYGVKVLEAHGSFSINGDYTRPKKSNGLTCATFVTEVVGSIGYRVLKEDTWPEGVNQAWIAAVVRMLRHEGADDDHIRDVENCVNARRICPAEVIVGGDTSFRMWPLTHEQVTPLVPTVDLALTEYCGLPGGGNVPAAAAGPASPSGQVAAGLG